MPTRTVTTDYERDQAATWIVNMKPPFTLSVVKGKRRSDAQNRLQRELLNQIAEQRPDQTAEEWRGYCKLTIGVPILRAENEAFAEAYDRDIKPLPYEMKLRMMMEPIDVAVTRHMTTVQKKTYIDRMVQHFAEQGVYLTLPEEQQRVA